MRAVIIIVLVVGALVGGLLVLRNSAATGVPDAEVLARARKRAQDQEAREAADRDQDGRA
jgi:TRAP-type mannitol/chloroaromatic compound transport system permease large subunit